MPRATGTIVKGLVQLDDPLDLPDGCRVRISVEPIEEWRERYVKGMATALRQLIRDRPTGSRGKFTRDELHERR